MDIIEFTETVCGIKLLEYEKELLREFERGLRVVPRKYNVESSKNVNLPQNNQRGLRATMLIFDDYMGEVKDE